jgi:hypothetical protein
VGANGAAPLLDDDGQPRTAIATVTHQSSRLAPMTLRPVYRTVPSGRPLLRLVGYDWDQTLRDRPRLYLHWQTEQGYQTETRDGPSATDFRLRAWFGPWGLLNEREWAPEPPSADSRYVPLGQGVILTGVSGWNQRPLAPGQRRTIAAHFLGRQPIAEDLVSSIRLIGLAPDGVTWLWWDLEDSVPAIGAIPTLKWVAGSAVRDPHFLEVAASASPGQPVLATLRLYDAFTGRPAPILDEGIAQRAPWIPLGQAVIRGE